MGIFRTNDPTQFDDVDGIIIDESAPAPSVKGVAANVAILVGKFQRGPLGLTSVGSVAELYKLFGKGDSRGVAVLKGKRFGSLKVIRVVAADAALATANLTAADNTVLAKLDAKQGKGVFGNSISVKVEAGSTAGVKLTVTDGSVGSVEAVEIYDNVDTATIVARLAASRLVAVTKLADGTIKPATYALAAGSDGTAADGDYSAALDYALVERAGNVIFLDEYTAARNAALKAHVAATQDKMAICSLGRTATKADAIAAAATLRDTQGRIIFAFNHIIDQDGNSTNPASWLASILSQTGPHINPAQASNAEFMAGATGVALPLSRQDYIDLRAAGVAAFERDEDIGIKLKSGVTTQIADSSKVNIVRRRMADYLTNSASLFLKLYQNGVNSQDKRLEAKSGIVRFVDMQEKAGILPSDKEMKSGRAKLIDVDSANTDDSISAGYFYIVWKQRIYSSMDFIVLQAQIGESVVVQEQE